MQGWSTTGKSKFLYEQAHPSMISALLRSSFTAQFMALEQTEEDMSAGEEGFVRMLSPLKVLWAPMAIRRLNFGANRIRCTYRSLTVLACYAHSWKMIYHLLPNLNSDTHDALLTFTVLQLNDNIASFACNPMLFPTPGPLSAKPMLPLFLATYPDPYCGHRCCNATSAENLSSVRSMPRINQRVPCRTRPNGVSQKYER